MFKVCLDATPIRDKPSGVGVYTLNLIKALDQLQESEDFKNPAILGLNKSKPTFIVWGDSHAVSISAGIDLEAKKYGLSGYLITKGSTIPFTGIESYPHKAIASWNSKVKQFILSNPDIRTVYLVAAWSNYANAKSGNFYLLDKIDYKNEDQHAVLKEGFSNTINWLKKLVYPFSGNA